MTDYKTYKEAVKKYEEDSLLRIHTLCFPKTFPILKAGFYDGWNACQKMNDVVILSLKDKHKEEMDVEQRCIERYDHKVENLEQENAKLKEEMKKDRDVLEFYADDRLRRNFDKNFDNYEDDIVIATEDHEYVADCTTSSGGKRARERLKEKE